MTIPQEATTQQRFTAEQIEAALDMLPWHAMNGDVAKLQGMLKQTLSDIRQPARAEAGVTREQVVAAVMAAMQEAWNDWVADTQCYPDDITQHTNGEVEFNAGSWANHVGDWTYNKLFQSAAAPCRDTAQEDGKS